MREKKRKKRKKLETAGSVLGDHLVTAARGGAHFRAQVVNKNQTDRQLEKKRKNSRIIISRKTNKKWLPKKGWQDAGCEPVAAASCISASNSPRSGSAEAKASRPASMRPSECVLLR